jgi:putative nucleotidyltransferase with HDIG domain
MLKRIDKDQLRVGMFIEALEGSSLDEPLAVCRFPLKDEGEAQLIRKRNAGGIFINTSKGLDVRSAGSSQTYVNDANPPSKISPASRGLRIQLATAEKIKRTSTLLKNIFADVSNGTAVTVEMVAPVIEEIIQSLDVNPSVLISMTRLKTKDEATFLHCLAVSALMIRLARHVKIDAAIVPVLGMGGLLHDIGKIGIPIEILTKTGALSGPEMELIRRHPTIGHQILSRGGGMPEIVLDICLHHHERLDGKGYPEVLKGAQMSLYARMATICDVYDALTSARPYKRPWTPLEATSWMLDAEGAFDRALLHKFVDGVVRSDR